ncbi:MAG: amidohydrolase [Bdellovibrionales bacterium]|nr:amidohydrolase [Bdellovibrionales bacterium]
MKGGLGEVDKDFFIGIQNNVIAVIEAFTDSHSKQSKKFIDASEQIVMPGLINGHTHLAMVMFRGFEDDRPFHEWLFNRILPLEANILDEDFVRIGTELGALESIRFGTTTVNDMYYFSEATADVLDKAGMRAIIAKPFIDFVVPDEKTLSNPLQTRSERYKKFHAQYRKHPRITPALGPHAPYTCGDSLLRQVASLAGETQSPIHMHVCETSGEVKESLEKYGMKPVPRLDGLGMFEGLLIAAHGVHLDNTDIEIMKRKIVSVVYNPDSNAKLGSGVCRVPDLRKAGIPVGLGTDGAASNNDLSLFGAMDLGTKVQKLSHQSNTVMVALDAINLATLEGARALGLEKEIGSIEVGKRADIITLRTDYPHTQPLYSVLSQIVYAYNGTEVDTVVCDGKILMENQKHQTLNARSIYERVGKLKLRVQEEHKKMKKAPGY